MAEPIIRQATPADAPGLVPLLEALGYPADGETIRQRLESLTEDPDGRVLLAVVGPSPVGFVSLHATPVLHRPMPVGRITALAVAPGRQGSGIGKRLVEAAERYFAERGWPRVEVTSGPRHARAHAFYRRLGYADDGVRFVKMLP